MIFAFSLFDMLADFIQKLFSILFDTFMYVVHWWCQFFSGQMVALLSSLPSGVAAPVSAVETAVEAANQWLALDVAFTLWSAWWGVYFSLQIYRLVKSWIPTLAG